MGAKPKSIKVNMTLKMVQEAVSFLYPLITVMYVIRTIGQKNYGEIQYVRSVISYFSMVASLGIGTYAAREGARVRDDKTRFQTLSNEIFTVSFLSTATALLLLTAFLALVAARKQTFNPLLYLIGAAPIAFSAIGRDWINTVYEDFTYMTVRYLTSSAVSTALIFLLIRKEQDYILYFLLVNGIGCVLALFNYHHVKQYSRIGFAPIRECRQHLGPIFMIFFSGIASSIYLNSDVTLLGILVSKEAVAVYSVAATVYTMVKVISNSMVSVTIPRLSYYSGTSDTERFGVLVNKMVDYVLIIVLPCLVGLAELRNHAMVFVGGAQYEGGGTALFVLSLALPFAVLANVFVQCVLLPRKKENVFLRATVISALVNISLNFVFLPWLSYLGAALTTLLAEIIIFFFLGHEAKKQVRITVRPDSLVTAVLGSLPIIAVCELVKRFVDNVYIASFAAVAGSGAAYYAVLVLRKHAIVNEINDLLRAVLRRRT